MSLKINSPVIAEKSLTEYSELCNNDLEHKADLVGAFNKKESRLDDFCFKELPVETERKHLSSILKLIFVLSHGQTTTDMCFSVNIVLNDHMKSNSIIAWKLIIGHLKKNDLTHQHSTYNKRTSTSEDVSWKV